LSDGSEDEAAIYAKKLREKLRRKGKGVSAKADPNSSESSDSDNVSSEEDEDKVKQEDRDSESGSNWSDSDEEEEEEEKEADGVKGNGDVKLQQELRESLRELPLKRLEKLKRDGINGIPLHKALGLPGPGSINNWLAGNFTNEKMTDTGNNEPLSKATKEEKYTIEKRRNKHAPLEVSSKQRVSRFRQVVHVPQAKRRDPRFDSLSGELKPDLFDKSYSFIDEYRDKEIEDLKAALKRDGKLRRKKNRKGRKGKKILEESEKSEMMAKLTRLQQEKAARKRNRTSRKVKSKANKLESEKVAAGLKRPFYLKKRDLKELELKEKYEGLKNEGKGKLDKYIAKRRKKNAQKERTLLPWQQ